MREQKIVVPAQFAGEFELVAAHYNLRECGEYDQAKDAARSDLENAQATYAALAEEIRKVEA